MKPVTIARKFETGIALVLQRTKIVGNSVYIFVGLCFNLCRGPCTFKTFTAQVGGAEKTYYERSKKMKNKVVVIFNLFLIRNLIRIT